MESFQVPRRLFKWVLYLLWYGVFALQLPAAFRVVLKDGTVLEARSKPVNMQSSYRFTDSEGRFRAIPFEQVDVEATKAASHSAETAVRREVITNENLGSGPPQPARTLSVPALAPEPLAPREEGSAPQYTESYWRELARGLQERIGEADQVIAELKAWMMQMGPPCTTALPWEECTLWDRRPELIAAEARKRALQAEYEALEERGRKAGVLPGWFR